MTRSRNILDVTEHCFDGGENSSAVGPSSEEEANYFA